MFNTLKTKGLKSIKKKKKNWSVFTATPYFVISRAGGSGQPTLTATKGELEEYLNVYKAILSNLGCTEHPLPAFQVPSCFTLVNSNTNPNS